jgi:hypothetical protein
MSSPAVYYGNPEILRTMNRNVASFVDASFNDQVSNWNGLVQPMLEADLQECFSSWPEPDNGQLTGSIASLWLYAMTAQVQAFAFSTNTIGATSARAQEMRDAYEKLLEDIKAGRKAIPGAMRVMGSPKSSTFASQRWKISKQDQPDEPEGVADQFKGDLRR